MEKTSEPKPVTARYLVNAASFYLQRYAATERQLRDILKRKVRKRTGAAPDESALALIDRAVETMRETGLLNDKAFAYGRTETLKRKGLSAGQARLKLASKGVDRELAAETVAAAEFDEVEQVLVTARRLRLGSFARGETRASRFDDNDIGKLARRGFSLSAIRAAEARMREDD